MATYIDSQELPDIETKKRPKFWNFIRHPKTRVALVIALVVGLGFLAVSVLNEDRGQTLATYAIGVGASLIAAAEHFSTRQRHAEAMERQEREDLYKTPDIKISHRTTAAGLRVKVENRGLIPASAITVQLILPNDIGPSIFEEVGQLGSQDSVEFVMEIHDVVLDKAIKKFRSGIPTHRGRAEWRSPQGEKFRGWWVLPKDFLKIWHSRRIEAEATVWHMGSTDIAPVSTRNGWPTPSDIKATAEVRKEAKRLIIGEMEEQ